MKEKKKKEKKEKKRKEKKRKKKRKREKRKEMKQNKTKQNRRKKKKNGKKKKKKKKKKNNEMTHKQRHNKKVTMEFTVTTLRVAHAPLLLVADARDASATRLRLLARAAPSLDPTVAAVRALAPARPHRPLAVDRGHCRNRETQSSISGLNTGGFIEIEKLEVL